MEKGANTEISRNYSFVQDHNSMIYNKKKSTILSFDLLFQIESLKARRIIKKKKVIIIFRRFYNFAN